MEGPNQVRTPYYITTLPTHLIMSYLIFFAILAVVLLDKKILQKFNAETFKTVFYFPRYWKLAAVLAFVLIATSSLDGLKAAPGLILLLILPIYMTRKRRFIRESGFYEKRDFEGKLPLSVFLSDAYDVIVTWFYVFFIFAIINKVLFNPKVEDSSLSEIIFTSILSSAVLLSLIAKAAKRFSDKGFSYNVGFKKGNWSIHKVFLIPFFTGLIFAGISAFIATTRHFAPITPLGKIIDATQSTSVIFIFILLAIFIAPLVEEIIFRGYFYQVLKKVKGTTFAIIIISLTFAILHVEQYWGDWLAIVMVTLLGFALTILRSRSGTTWASVITHYVYNGGVTLIPIIIILLSNSAYFKYQTKYFTIDSQTKEGLLKENIRNNPKFYDAYNDLAWLYATEERNLEEALSLINKALDFDSNNVAYLDTKLEVLSKLKKIEDAQAILNKILSIIPDYNPQDYRTELYSK